MKLSLEVLKALSEIYVFLAQGNLRVFPKDYNVSEEYINNDNLDDNIIALVESEEVLFKTLYYCGLVVADQFDFYLNSIPAFMQDQIGEKFVQKQIDNLPATWNHYRAERKEFFDNIRKLLDQMRHKK